MKVKSLSQVQLLVSPWTAAYQAPPSMGFSRQEYWSGVPLPSPLFQLASPKLVTLPCLALLTEIPVKAMAPHSSLFLPPPDYAGVSTRGDVWHVSCLLDL